MKVKSMAEIIDYLMLCGEYGGMNKQFTREVEAELRKQGYIHISEVKTEAKET
jgi:hypothetical protein